MHDQLVDERRHGPEPRAEVGDQLREGDPGAEQDRVLRQARPQPERPEQPDTEAGAQAHDRREERLAFHVAGERLLDPDEQRRRPARRREAAIDRSGEPLHVEQHVDGDHEQEYQAEQQLHRPDRRALDEVDHPRRVFLDVLRADVVDGVVELLADLDSAQSVVVEPDLQAVDVALGMSLRRLSVLGRKVGIDPM